MSFRLGVDIGGTFTDFALFDEQSGTMRIHKQLTTPEDPSIAVLDGIGRVLVDNDIPIDRADLFAEAERD
jgi:N-methylhydantoinase A/oxoprolinase/acetone carboxylase beta subunit